MLLLLLNYKETSRNDTAKQCICPHDLAQNHKAAVCLFGTATLLNSSRELFSGS